MVLNKQPLRGLIPIIFVVIGSILFIVIGSNLLGLDPGTLSVYALFFVWTAFLISLSDKWPFQKVEQPYVGLIFLTVALIIGVLHPVAMNVLGFGPEYYWPLISNLFLGVGLVIAFGNKLVNGLSQPKAVALNTLFCYVLAALLIKFMGFVPALWFALFVYVIFWLEQWPVLNLAQPSKGILSFVIIGFLSLILDYGFKLAGTSFFKPDAGLWFVIWVWWLVAFSWQLETWPVKGLSQPVKGIAGLGITIALTFISYYIVTSSGLDAGTAGSYVWIFVSWLYAWDIVFSKWPAELILGKS
ncbi:MAG: hypothetical protein M0Q13_13990 [Methanothrix sp.]|nr:hypothetical protein [Methanothrix sp.]